ncbi:L-threonylcarbamoyladenylate synthase [Moraxella oblonga]|uniref:L-threonylcarbamoyladenylate synthase n=1 Tax=Moraxella oblonga TaxID=200413 RepID=UPI000829E474|nr:Sua5/YciO/YrdC/YwlC family protein [Moraxella oblonga]
MNDIAHQLKQGKLIAYPTETVWGIGCDAFCEKAVMDLLSIKNRPIDKGLIVLTDKVERISPFLQALPTDRQAEIVATWQHLHTTKQATTWLFPIPNGTKIPMWLTGSHDSLAIRVINHPAIAKLCASLVDDDNPYGFLVSTSCNPTALPPAHDLYTAMSYFGSGNVMFLDGKTLGFDKPSQIRCAVGGGVIRI